MTNDPRDKNGERLKEALLKLGRDKDVRAQLMHLLMSWERSAGYTGSVRDDITGPIIDALHSDHDQYEKSLSDGTRFQFLFRTKIARDFLLSENQTPDHVWEPQTTKLMMNLAKRRNGDVLIGGAYFGDQAILVAKQIAEGGRRLHAFEPNAEQAAMCRKNAEINGLSNIDLSELGLWSQSSVKLKLDGFDSFANAVLANSDSDAFQTVTIDDYCSQRSITLSLIELDIEGAELAALKGAEKTLRRDSPDVVFEVHRSYVDWSQGLQNTEICRYLSEIGYQIYAVRDFNTHYEMQGKKIELIPVDKVFLEGPPHGFNMFATKDLHVLDEGLFRIVENVSPKLLIHKDPALHHPLDGL